MSQDGARLVGRFFPNSFSFPSLSLHRSGTETVNVQQNMLNHLGDGCFYLQDFEMDQSEIPLLVKFLQSKTAVREVKSVELALKPGLAPQDRRRKPTVNSKNVSKHPEASSNKLLIAVCDFIKSSHGLESIIVDNVTFVPEILTRLGDAMSHMHII